MSRKKVDISGKIFGRLTAISATDKRDATGSVVWKCVCSCGSENVEISGVQLRRGITKSCGCLQSEWRDVRFNRNRRLKYRLCALFCSNCRGQMMHRAGSCLRCGFNETHV